MVVRKKNRKRACEVLKRGLLLVASTKNTMNAEIPRPGVAADGTKVFCFVCRGAEA